MQTRDNAIDGITYINNVLAEWRTYSESNYVVGNNYSIQQCNLVTFFNKDVSLRK